MKTLRILLCLVVVICGIMNASAEARFFKANSVLIEYEYYVYDNCIPDPLPPDWNGNLVEYHPAKMWTGNDTIVDGLKCVTLWDQDEGKEPICVGCVREDDDGWVWRYEMVTSKFVVKSEYEGFMKRFNITDKWTFLYDFSQSDWEEGMTIQKWGSSPTSPSYSGRIVHCWTQTLETGEVVPVADGIVYGIGQLSWPFEGNRVVALAYYEAHVLEYWRDGELLIKNESKQRTSVERMTKPCTSTILFDLTGCPADGTQKGIYIRNGKKVMVK